MGYSPNKMHNPTGILTQYQRAKFEHDKWLSVWRDCYNFTCPTVQDGNNKTLYDATACDAVDELSSVLMGEIIPRNKDWVSIADTDTTATNDIPKNSAIKHDILSALRQSNLHMELHQAVTDVVVAGTGVLLVENPNDMASPYRKTTAVQYTAIRPDKVVLSDMGQNGVLDTLFRVQTHQKADFITLYGAISGVSDTPTTNDTPAGEEIQVLESIIPCQGKWYYTVQTLNDNKTVLKKSVYKTCPFVAFRWQRSSDSIYGKSPVMKTLPDIKTANKVVELTLKNAAISVTGIWQADDDGVLNPYTVRLVPGAIIPKAVGSKGLQPLQSPGEFDVSNMVLSNLQGRIRKGLLADIFTTTVNRSATEVQQHALRSRQVLNAVFERLSQECLTPLLHRSIAVLEQNGIIPPLQTIGVRAVVVSPMERIADSDQLARLQTFLTHIKPYEDMLPHTLNMPETLRWVADKMGLPTALLQKSQNPLLGEQAHITDLIKTHGKTYGETHETV